MSDDAALSLVFDSEPAEQAASRFARAGETIKDSARSVAKEIYGTGDAVDRAATQMRAMADASSDAVTRASRDAQDLAQQMARAQQAIGEATRRATVIDASGARREIELTQQQILDLVTAATEAGKAMPQVIPPDVVPKVDGLGSSIENVRKAAQAALENSFADRIAKDAVKAQEELAKLQKGLDGILIARQRMQQAAAQSQADSFAKRLSIEMQQAERDAMKLQRGIEGIVAARKRMQQAGFEAQMSAQSSAMASQISLRDPFQRAAADIEKLTPATTKGVQGLGQLKEALTSAVRATLGLNPAVAQVTSVIGTLTLGVGTMIGVMAGVAAIGWVWNKLTEDARRAKEAIADADRVIQGLRDRAGVGSIDSAIAAKALEKSDIGDKIAEAYEKLTRVEAARTHGAAALRREIDSLLKQEQAVSGELKFLGDERTRIHQEKVAEDQRERESTLEKIRTREREIASEKAGFAVAQLEMDRQRALALTYGASDVAIATLNATYTAMVEHEQNAVRALGIEISRRADWLAQADAMTDARRQEAIDIARITAALKAADEAAKEIEARGVVLTPSKTKTPIPSVAPSVIAEVDANADAVKRASAAWADWYQSWRRIIHDWKEALTMSAQEGFSAFTGWIEYALNGGRDSFGRFADDVMGIMTRLAASIAGLELAKRFLPDDIGKRIFGKNFEGDQLEGRIGSIGRGAIAGIGGAAIGYGIGHSTGNAGIGAVGGALGGFMAGNAILPGIGGAIGAFAGLAGGIIGAGKAAREAEERMRSMRAEFQTSFAAYRQEVNGTATDLTRATAAAQAQSEAFRKQIEEAYAGKKHEAERNRLLAENEALEQKRIQQLQQEAAAQSALAAAEKARRESEMREDLRVETLRSQGLAGEADALAIAIDNQRRYEQAVRDNASAETLAMIETANAARVEAQARERAIALVNQLAEKEKELAEARERALRFAEDAAVRWAKLMGDLAGADRLGHEADDRRELAGAGSAADRAVLEVLQMFERAQRAAQQAIDAQRVELEKQTKLLQDQLATAQRALEETRRVAQSLSAASDSMKFGSLSPLSTKDQFVEARRQFEQAAATSYSGNPEEARAAAARLPELARQLLEAARPMYGSTTKYADVYRNVEATLADLATRFGAQASIEERTIKVIEDQLKALEAQLAALTSANNIATETRRLVLESMAASRDRLAASIDGGVLSTLEQIKVGGEAIGKLSIDSLTAAMLESRNAAVNAANAEMDAIARGASLVEIAVRHQITVLETSRAEMNARAIAQEAALRGIGELTDAQISVLESTRIDANRAAQEYIAAVAAGADKATQDRLAMIASIEAQRLTINEGVAKQVGQLEKMGDVGIEQARQLIEFQGMAEYAARQQEAAIRAGADQARIDALATISRLEQQRVETNAGMSQQIAQAALIYGANSAQVQALEATRQAYNDGIAAQIGTINAGTTATIASIEAQRIAMNEGVARQVSQLEQMGEVGVEQARQLVEFQAMADLASRQQEAAIRAGADAQTQQQLATIAQLERQRVEANIGYSSQIASLSSIYGVGSAQVQAAVAARDAYNSGVQSQINTISAGTSGTTDAVYRAAQQQIQELQNSTTALGSLTGGVYTLDSTIKAYLSAQTSVISSGFSGLQSSFEKFGNGGNIPTANSMMPGPYDSGLVLLPTPSIPLDSYAPSGTQTSAELLAELRALRQEVQTLRAEMERNTNTTAIGSEQETKAIERVADATSAMASQSRLSDDLAIARVAI